MHLYCAFFSTAIIIFDWWKFGVDSIYTCTCCCTYVLQWLERGAWHVSTACRENSILACAGLSEKYHVRPLLTLAHRCFVVLRWKWHTNEPEVNVKSDADAQSGHQTNNRDNLSLYPLTFYSHTTNNSTYNYPWCCVNIESASKTVAQCYYQHNMVFNWQVLNRWPHWYIICKPLRKREIAQWCINPANTTHWNNVGLMLGQRRRRWANIKPTLFQCVVFAGKRWTVKGPPDHNLGPAFSECPVLRFFFLLQTHAIRSTTIAFGCDHVKRHSSHDEPPWQSELKVNSNLIALLWQAYLADLLAVHEYTCILTEKSRPWSDSPFSIWTCACCRLKGDFGL